jgi:lipopolysaccharide transport system permease protein
MFVKRDLVAQYKQTLLGPIWHIVQPVLTTVMFLLVFSEIANIPTDGIHPVLFYMSGITIWNYFTSCLNNTSNTFVANAGIFGKVYFPRLVLPLSVVLSNIVKLGIQFGLLMVVMVYFAVFKNTSIHFGLHWLLIPVLVIIMAGIGLGLGIIISSLTTKYRDFAVLIGFGVQLLMYATPVVYPLSFLKGKSYAWILEWNPLSGLMEGFRYALFGTHGFELASLVYSFIFMVIVLIFGTMMFSKVERTFMDTV